MELRGSTALVTGAARRIGRSIALGLAARGANVAAVLPAALDEAGGQAYLSTKASVAKTGRFRRLALSQWTDNQRKRGLAPEVSLYDLAQSGGIAHFVAAAQASESVDNTVSL